MEMSHLKAFTYSVLHMGISLHAQRLLMASAIECRVCLGMKVHLSLYLDMIHRPSERGGGVQRKRGHAKDG